MNVVQFMLKSPLEEAQNDWLVSKPGEETDLCCIDPKFTVDLCLICGLKALTGAWMGYSIFEKEISDGRVSRAGHDIQAQRVIRWLIRSRLAEAGAAAGSRRSVSA